MNRTRKLSTNMDEMQYFINQVGKEFRNARGNPAACRRSDLDIDTPKMITKKDSSEKHILPNIEHMKVFGETLGSHRPHAAVQDFESIRNQCLKKGVLFVDPLFPANRESLKYTTRRASSLIIKWLRPHEIAKNPKFCVDGFSRFDIRQGTLGNCWFLAAVANITLNLDVFERVVPMEQNFVKDYAGIFHFRFWQYGKWLDIVIDDRLPTYNGKLIYMRSTAKNEFWSALLEKAYAKLHGTYESLNGGMACEAMIDFTAGVCEYHEVKKNHQNLFSILIKAVQRNSMISTAIKGDPNVNEEQTPDGLVRGHAYSVTKVCWIDIQTGIRLEKKAMIRLRNPWGNVEWNGAWSDRSSEWRTITEDQKSKIGLNFEHDGEFWMSYSDFVEHFDVMEICNLPPELLTARQLNDGKRMWEVSMFEGEWTRGSTAGGCANYLNTFWHNPQYVITVDQPDEDADDAKFSVLVALLQKNRRAKRNSPCLCIGFYIYQLNDKELQKKPQDRTFFKYKAPVGYTNTFVNRRDVTERFKFSPGHYLIIPATFNPNEEGEFIIRVFSEAKNNMEENDEHVSLEEIDDVDIVDLTDEDIVDITDEDIVDITDEDYIDLTDDKKKEEEKKEEEKKAEEKKAEEKKAEEIEIEIEIELPSPSKPDRKVKAPDSPVKIPDTPVKVPDTPVKIPDSPVKIPDTPVKVPDTPVKIPDTPVKVPDTPVKIPDSPVKIPDTPVKIPDSPVKIPDTPVKIPDSPVKIPDSPVKIPDSPVKIPDSPIKPANNLRRQILRRMFNSVAGDDREMGWEELKSVLDHALQDDLPKHLRLPKDLAVKQNFSVVSNVLSWLWSGIYGLFGQDYTTTQEQEIDEDKYGFSKDICRSMVAMMDTDRSGKLKFEEFEALMMDIAKWKTVFQMYDCKRNGLMDGFQLRDAFKSGGVHLNNHILNSLLHRYGCEDGKITFDDFLMCAVKLKTFIDAYWDKLPKGSETATFNIDEWVESTIYS